MNFTTQLTLLMPHSYLDLMVAMRITLIMDLARPLQIWSTQFYRICWVPHNFWTRHLPTHQLHPISTLQLVPITGQQTIINKRMHLITQPIPY